MYEKIVVIAGSPRSGTSWLGQIVDSSPQVRYRFQPLFSWAFKDTVHAGSTPEEFESFFKAVYQSDDDFLCQTERRRKGIYPNFDFKDDLPETLTIKMIRYHHLLPVMIKYFEQLKVVGIIRHPCGTIHSWLNNPKEFPKDVDPIKEWRFGLCRNQKNPNEYWGFEAWKRICFLFSKLEKEYPARFKIIQYESLVDQTIEQTESLFQFLQLPLTSQTVSFLDNCHKHNVKDKYSVYKSKDVKDQWKTQLHQAIRDEIINEVKSTDLCRFLVE